MRLSARNQLRARVTSVAHGGVMSTIKTVLADGQVVTAVITKESAQDLDLAPDDEVLVVMTPRIVGGPTTVNSPAIALPTLQGRHP